ncbi:MFS transporter [Jiangella rhizosphaerae]|uniref:MFS transporter n=1 Tax=Jiangella rhizosphaerae TaxID=2293569 RepID=A0A418KVD5_9ACTN|nr:MFS transporter [Jiangella rhizosphaerae]RIQ32486.1 MFS transporter [Jiangella rhizosphaerae]
MSTPSPLRQRDFRLLLLGQTTSQFGAQVSGIAIPLLAVITLGASALEAGLLAAASTVAFAVIGLPAGAWIDRMRRRPVLIAADLARAVLLATIPLAAVAGVLTVTQLIVVALLTGVARVFFDIGYQSYLPVVIGRDRVLAGNSAMETVRASGQFAGPGLGGWLTGLLGGAVVVLVQAVTFLVSAAALFAIRTPEPPPRELASRQPARGRLRTEIRAGLAFVRHTPALRATALTSAVANFCFAIAAAVSVIFMARMLELSPSAIGLIVAAGSATVLAAAAVTPWLSRRVGSARLAWLCLVVTGPAGLLIPLAEPGWTAIAFLIVGIGAGEVGQIIYAIASVSLRQRITPDELLGRVNATMRVLIMGAFPLGGLAGGVLGELAGPRATLWVVGVLTLLAPLPVWWVLRGTRDVEELDPAGP